MKNQLHRILGLLLIAMVVLEPHATTGVKPASKDLAEQAEPQPSAAGQSKQARVRQAYGQVPLYFETNRGQADPSVKFLSRGRGYSLFLTSTEAVLTLRDASSAERRQGDANTGRQETMSGSQPYDTQDPKFETVLRIKQVGANPRPQVVGSDQLPGKINYVKGKDPKRWVTEVPTFAKVTYGDVYPDVDLVYYGNQGELEYDFNVAPGGDPNQITLAFEGADKLEVDRQGDLVLQTLAGALRQRKPFIYQEIDGVRREVPGGYVVKGRRHIGFQLASYDTTHPLVIDPLLHYSTYLGGNGDDAAAGIALDAGNNLYVTGTTESTNFPTTPDAHQQVLRGDSDVFVTKFDASGSLVYSTYLGDCAEDEAFDIAVDSAGNAYVTGRANSGLCFEFPRPAAFVAKLNSGGGLAPGGYFFLFGGAYDSSSKGHSIAVDAQGHAYVAGATLENDFPTTPNAFRPDPCPGGEAFVPIDGFVAKVNAAGNDLVYSTFLCGSGDDSPNGIGVDPDGYAYVAGYTGSSDFPTQPSQPHPGEMFTYNGFVTKLTPDGSTLVYSTYLGGDSDDVSTGLAVHAASRNAYVTGWTRSYNFPTTPGAVQPNNPEPCAGFGSSCQQAFVTRFNASGTRVYSTYLYGEDGDQGNDIAVDPSGNAYIAGVTYSRYFPIVNAFQPNNSGALGTLDGFVAKLNPNGSELVYSSYLGGSNLWDMPLEGDDSTSSIAVDSGGNAVVVGSTNSFNFPTTPNARQPHLDGGTCGYLGYVCYDTFVTKIAAQGPGVIPDVSLEVSATNVRVGGILTATWAGISTPTSSDRLRLVKLGTSSVDTLVSDWPTTGTGSGSRQLRLPTTLQPGTYELRLITDVNFELTDLARSRPFKVTR